MNITVEDVIEVFPRPLMDDEKARAEALVNQSIELIGMEFARRSRDFDAEVETSRWLIIAVKHAVRVMVSQAVLIGDNVGRASASSTTGPQSDAVTWSQGIGIHWGGVGIDVSVLELLGLIGGTVPLGRGGTVIAYGERAPFPRGAEFSERRWP